MSALRTMPRPTVAGWISTGCALRSKVCLFVFLWQFKDESGTVGVALVEPQLATQQFHDGLTDNKT